jgi:hypothetical protein
MFSSSIGLELRERKGNSLTFGVTGIPPVVIERAPGTVVRRVGAMSRVKVVVSEEASEKLRIMEDLFTGAIRDQWDRWFKSDVSELDDLVVPVISINGKGQHVATMMTADDWSEGSMEASCKLASAVFDKDGLSTYWSIETVPAGPEPEAVTELDVDAAFEKEKRRALKAKKARAIRRLAEKQVAALFDESDSDA